MLEFNLLILSVLTICATTLGISDGASAAVVAEETEGNTDFYVTYLS